MNWKPSAFDTSGFLWNCFSEIDGKWTYNGEDAYVFLYLLFQLENDITYVQISVCVSDSHIILADAATILRIFPN